MIKLAYDDFFVWIRLISSSFNCYDSRKEMPPVSKMSFSHYKALLSFVSAKKDIIEKWTTPESRS